MRVLDPLMLAALQASVVVPAFLVSLQFKSGPQYIWSGVGPLVYNSNTYLGVGSLGGVGTISEGTEVQADGTALTLSGIDPALYSACLTDIQLGAPAQVWFACMSNGQIIGTPYLLFSGQVDKPHITTGANTITISLALENRLANLQRASARLWTAADQNMEYPTDSAFNFVEILNDMALRWGS